MSIVSIAYLLVTCATGIAFIALWTAFMWSCMRQLLSRCQPVNTIHSEQSKLILWELQMLLTQRLTERSSATHDHQSKGELQ